MPNLQLQNVNFGQNRADATGSTGVGYTLMDFGGNIVAARTTAGVYQLASGSGLYAAYVSWPDNFNGQILWDCPPMTSSLPDPDDVHILSQSYATEQYNVQANDPLVAATYTLLSGTVAPNVQAIYDMEYGRWKLDPTTNQMYFYDPSGLNLIATFNMYDNTFTPATDAVYQRQNTAYPSPGP
jgi:hypothetical protein